MIRDFAYTPKLSLVREVLRHFPIAIPNEPHAITLLRFEVLTPDSCMWRLLIADQVYYLYSEDFIPGLAYVKEVFSSYLGSTGWNLVARKKAGNFHTSSPVAGSTVYKEPDDVDALMKYAVDSGHDFVFLAQSQEDSSGALFAQ